MSIDNNDSRADHGEDGIIAASPDWLSNEVYIGVKDAVANICHAIARMGLDPEELLSAGHGSFEEDNNPDEIGGYEPVAHDTARFPDPVNELPSPA